MHSLVCRPILRSTKRVGADHQRPPSVLETTYTHSSWGPTNERRSGQLVEMGNFKITETKKCHRECVMSGCASKMIVSEDNELTSTLLQSSEYV